MNYPRLHVLFARDAEYAVVLRRGPSKVYCSIGWDRSTDTFTIGQWVNARIYERRSHLSPDGKHLIYFAANHRLDSETKGTYTAISKVPYLKALGLWGKGDCWNGGGLFLSDKEFWINGYEYHFTLSNPKGLRRRTKYPFKEFYGNECEGVYFYCLQMNWWKLISRDASNQSRRVTVFEKKVNDQWILRKNAIAALVRPEGKGCYYDEHQLLDTFTGVVTDCPAEWEWVDCDEKGIYWAEKGKLYSGQVGERGVEKEKELFDFNGMEFEPLKAPY